MFFIMRNSCSVIRIQLYVVCGSFGKMHRERGGFPQKEDFCCCGGGHCRIFGSGSPSRRPGVIAGPYPGGGEKRYAWVLIVYIYIEFSQP